MKRPASAALLLCLVPVASAITLDVDWLIGSGSWNTAVNWSAGNLPNASDSVRIDPNGLGAVTVTITSPATAYNLSVGANDTVAINNNQSLTLDAGGTTTTLNLESGAALTLNSVGNATRLYLEDGDVTVTGSGSIDLGTGSANAITGVNGTESLLNQATIQGAGQIGANALSIENSGTITALYSTPLILDPATLGSFLNSGLLEAASGGVLRLNTGTLLNTAGTIHARDGGTVQLTGIEIQDGTLSSADSGKIVVTGASTVSSGVTLTSGSQLLLNNNQSLSFADTLTLDGTLSLNSVGNATDLIGSATTATLAGTGGIDLSNNTANRIYSSSAAGLIINRTTIEGAGQIGANIGAFTNEGTLRALYSSPLTLDPGSGGFTNTGTLIAASGGQLTLNGGAYTNTGGTVSADDGGTVTLAGSVTLTGGQLSSAGAGLIRNTGDNTLDSVILTPGTELRLSNNTRLSVLNALTNRGTIQLGSVGNATDLIFGSATVSLDGGGTIDLSANNANRLYGSVATHHLTNLDNTLRGGGQIGVNQLVFTNQGTVEANLSGQTLSLDPASGGFFNSGTYQAVNGGILELANGDFDNTGGTIRAQSNSTVRLTGAVVTGGDLDLGPAATLELGTASFSGGTLTTTTGSTLKTIGGSSTLGGTINFNLNPGADLIIGNNSSLILAAAGTYQFDGTLTLDSIGNTTDLILSEGDVTLSGSGSVHLDNSNANRVYGLSATDRLILSGVDVHGGGQLGLNQLGLVNQAVITADASTGLTIDPSAAGLTNSGTLRADGGTLVLTDATINNTGGTIEALTGSTARFDNSATTAGTLSGPGTLSVAGTNTFTDITVANGTTLTLANNTTTTFIGSLQNPGLIELTSIGNTTDFIAGTGGLTLNGGGDIALGTNNANRLYGASAAVTLTNVDNTLRGAGQLGVNQLVLDNQATIRADLAGRTLTLDLADPGLTNSGLLLATNGATLALSNSTITNQSTGILRAETGATVTFSGVTLHAGHLEGTGTFRATGANTFADLTLDAASTLALDNNTANTFTGTLTNAGTIDLNSIGNPTDFIAGTGGLTLDGGGVIELSGSNANRLYAVDGATTLTNQNQTIAGYGSLGVDQLILDNRALITANVSGQTLTVDTSGALTNTGTLRAQQGGTLELANLAIANTGGVITADAGSGITLNGATITGGNLAGALTVGATPASLDSLTLNPDTVLTVPNARRLNLTGAIDLQGTIELTTLGHSTDLVVTGTGAQLGPSTGTIQLGGNTTRIYGDTASATLQIGSSQTIRGAGQLGVDQLHLENHGTLAADASSALVVDLANPLNNDGTLAATGTGGFTFHDALNNNATVDIGANSVLDLGANPYTQNAGETTLDGGLLAGSHLQFDGGTLSGHGDLEGTVAFADAILSPHDGPLILDSSLTLSAATITRFELAGPNPATDYGSIQATALTLDGNLYLRFADGFENSILATDSFTLLSATSALTGVFANAPDGSRIGLFNHHGSFAINYGPLAVTLTDFQPIPEPSTWALLTLGSGLVLLARRRLR